uniref:Reverse transcriptase domain-containing protein n=1 Tax=Sphaeramia orbicularis TaxID=375764 RepID=A0A672Z5A6_9TELE
LLLYISNPLTSIKSILSLLKKFGSFSGYKVNLLKSGCFPINYAALLIKQSDLPFKLSTSGFRYLQINVTRSLSSLYVANFTPLLNQTKADLHRWNSLPLSLMGRTNAVKKEKDR